MQHLNSLENISIDHAWVTIGSFDGVHLGHKSILKDLQAQAHLAHHPAVVITFYPHPAIVLNKNKTPYYYLSAPEERARLLEEIGVDYTFTLHFDQQFAAQSADVFFEKILQHINIAELWVGYDFALGHDRSGDISSIKAIALKNNFKVKTISPLLLENGKPISSSQIRELIVEGKVDEAAKLLGRYYEIPGIVVSGDRRGGRLGFPTANINYWPEKVLPALGVYATWTWVDQIKYASVTNVGIRPTFEHTQVPPRIETHLLDYHGDVYEKELQVDFVSHIRDEKKFDGVNGLINQIENDKKVAREVLRNET
ncbi:MAG: bifunctional riboflavin kinase/FAD synthetase [Anaerolineaceae bacterium]